MSKVIEKMTKQDKQWLTSWSCSQRGVGSDAPKLSGQLITYQIKLQHNSDKLKLTLANGYSDQPQHIKYIAIASEFETEFELLTVEGETAFFLMPNDIKKTDIIDKTVARKETLYIQMCYETVITEGYNLLVAVDSYVSRDATTVVGFGDSITEQGYWITPLKQAVYETLGEGYSVVNAGISGNRLLRGFSTLPVSGQYFGISGVARFERDVFKVTTNVHVVIIALGVNDLHQPGTDSLIPIDELPTFEELVVGYEQLFHIANQYNCRVYVATIGSFIGYTVDVKNTEKEILRKRINHWLLHHAKVDGVYDFSDVLVSDSDPTRLDSRYDSGDKLHPSEKGGAAMSQIIEVKAFENCGCLTSK